MHSIARRPGGEAVLAILRRELLTTMRRLERGSSTQAGRKRAIGGTFALRGSTTYGGDPERARIPKRLGQVSEDSGHVSEAARRYRGSVEAWEQLLKRRTVADELLDAAESWIA